MPASARPAAAPPGLVCKLKDGFRLGSGLRKPDELPREPLPTACLLFAAVPRRSRLACLSTTDWSWPRTDPWGFFTGSRVAVEELGALVRSSEEIWSPLPACSVGCPPRSSPDAGTAAPEGCGTGGTSGTAGGLGGGAGSAGSGGGAGATGTSGGGAPPAS